MSKLEPLPPSFAATRDALHRVAEKIVAPARKPDNEIALTVTTGGFGTPPFEHDGRRLVVRVEGTELVIDTDGVETRGDLTSLADAGRLVGATSGTSGSPTSDSRAATSAPSSGGMSGTIAPAAPAPTSSAANSAGPRASTAFA